MNYMVKTLGMFEFCSWKKRRRKQARLRADQSDEAER